MYPHPVLFEMSLAADRRRDADRRRFTRTAKTHEYTPPRVTPTVHKRIAPQPYRNAA